MSTPTPPTPTACVCGPEATCQYHQEPGAYFTLSQRLATAEAEWDAALDAKHAKLVEVADKLQAARERVTRAEALLGEFELSDEIDNRGDEDGTQCEPWWMCLHCGGPMDECDLVCTCLGARVRAFLAPTEPDGASETKPAAETAPTERTP